MLTIGVIGFGYWGPNLVRNFHRSSDFRLAAVCDADPEMRARAAQLYPEAGIFSDHRELIRAADIDVVAIATPVDTHFELAREALENGKSVFVEKPFTSTIAQAEALIELAERKNLTLMVDHTFLFTGSVRKIKSLIDDGTLGATQYFDSTRINLGLFQHDVNVVWDLATHDFSIMDYLIDASPTAVAATGIDHYGQGMENLAFITVFFPDNMIAHFNVNWISPVKVRKVLIGGDKKMLIWDDLQADEKIKVFDKGVEIKTKAGMRALQPQYRTGDAWIPKVDTIEALQVETDYFAECIRNGDTPLNDGQAGLRIMRLLTACDHSLRSDSRIVAL